MYVEERYLKQNMMEYLQSPSGREALEDVGLPWLVSLGFQIACFPLGILLVLSIVWSKAGAELLGAVFTPGAFTHPGNQLRKELHLFEPMTLCGVIIGPQGHCLALGSLDPETNRDYEFLSREASRFANLYQHGSEDPRDAEIVEMLRQDRFHPGRRRSVPDSHSGGRSLTFFDAHVDRDKGCGEYKPESSLDEFDPDNPRESLTNELFRQLVGSGVFMLYAVSDEKHGSEIVQLPWELTEARLQPPREAPVPVPIPSPTAQSKPPILNPPPTAQPKPLAFDPEPPPTDRLTQLLFYS
ncbi:MAG: hypothetical protein N2C14_32445, partial [Planctomycetales bacterium]